MIRPILHKFPEGYRASMNELSGVSRTQKTTASNYLPPRVVLLGRLVPGGGGGRGTSSHSSEPGGGKFIPGDLGGGSSLLGDTGVGSKLLSSASSCDLPSDTEAIERVISLRTKSAPRFQRGTHP